MPRNNDLILTASDGVRIAAQIWSPSLADPYISVVICGGAGISSKYYARFAEFLCEANATVLTFDYRGVGKSRPRRLRGFHASVEDWGGHDCNSAIEYLLKLNPRVPLALVGHSVGGFLAGLAPLAARVSKMALVGAHTAYWRDYAKSQRFSMYLLWHIFMPVVARAVGYFPGRALRISEDIPKDLAIEWANRRHPDFWANVRASDGSPDVQRIERALSRFKAIHAELLAIRLADDAFATQSATARVLSLYSACTSTTITVKPNDVGVRAAGHFAYFRPDFKETVWNPIRNFVFG